MTFDEDESPEVMDNSEVDRSQGAARAISVRKCCFYTLIRNLDEIILPL
jgi:hypothetical protein